MATGIAATYPRKEGIANVERASNKVVEMEATRDYIATYLPRVDLQFIRYLSLNER